MCSARTAIANIESDKPFRIWVADDSDRSVDILPQKVVASVSKRPENVMKSHMAHEKILVIIADDRDAKFRKRKRHVDVREARTINNHLIDQLEQHMGNDEKQMKPADMTRNVPSD